MAKRMKYLLGAFLKRLSAGARCYIIFVAGKGGMCAPNAATAMFIGYPMNGISAPMSPSGFCSSRDSAS